MKIAIIALCSTITLSMVALTAHDWQKWKGVFLICPYNEIYRDEAVGLKVANILKNTILYEYVELKAISWKYDILSITASLKFEFKH